MYPVKLCLKTLQLIMISHDITQLLLLMIIDSGKKCTISIIDKQKFIINRQNRLVAHPYYELTFSHIDFDVILPEKMIYIKNGQIS